MVVDIATRVTEMTLFSIVSPEPSFVDTFGIFTVGVRPTSLKYGVVYRRRRLCRVPPGLADDSPPSSLPDYLLSESDNRRPSVVLGQERRTFVSRNRIAQ